MKKIIIILILILLIVSSNVVVFAETEVNNSYGYDFLVDFIEKHPYRDAGTDEELQAALYMSDYFTSLNLERPDTTVNNHFQNFSYTNPYNKKSYNSQNVIGIKRGVNSNGKQIIIGAHYDSVYKPTGLNTTAGEGAYDNGSGVAALAQVAYQLKDTVLNIDIIYVAFGAEEMGLFGSKYMAENMTEQDINNMILMINLDSIACGDYLYLYTDEVKNIQEDYMLNVAKEKNIELRAVPQDKKAYPSANDLNGLNYLHIMFMSDHSPFMRIGIDTAMFLGYNMEMPLIAPIESRYKPKIMHSEADNLINIIDLYGETVNKRIDDVASLVVHYVSDDNIISIMQESKTNKFNYKWMTNTTMIRIINISVKAIVIIIFYIIGYIYMKKEKAHKLLEESDNIVKTDNYVFDDLKI